MIKRNKDSLSNIHVPVSRSPKRISSTFGTAQRFIPRKSFSPDRFYDIPDSLNKRGAGIGYGNKMDLVLKQQNEPAKYAIRSKFDQIVEGYRFGLRTQPQQAHSRDYSYHCKPHHLRHTQNQESPQRKSPSKSKKVSPAKSNNKTKGKDVNRGNFYDEQNEPRMQRKSALRLKYEYSQNYLLGKQRTSSPKKMRKNSSKERSKSPLTGGKSLHPDEDRVKLKDYRSRLGPGSYNVFSEFGHNLRQ